MYKPETIQRAARLLDMMDATDDPVIEVNFDDVMKRVEVWNNLADNEHIIAMADYPEEQQEATKEVKSDSSNCIGIGGSLIPTLLEGVSMLISESRLVMDHEFVFDGENEILRVVDCKTNMQDLTVSY